MSTALAMPASSPNVARFQWTAQRAKAALLVAEDRLTNDEIAAQVGVTSRQLERWKQHPDFKARVELYVEERWQRMKRYRIARDDDRIADLQEYYDQLAEMRQAFAADPETAALPGGSTGLVRRQLKQIGAGRDAQMAEVVEVDYGWGKARRETVDEARKILGKDKGEAGAGEGITRVYVGVRVELV